jgi:hypothetical protein
MFWLVSSLLLFIGSMWHLRASCLGVRESYVATHSKYSKWMEFPKVRYPSPLSRGGALMERGAYLLRGGDFPSLLICHVAFRLSTLEWWHSSLIHMSFTTWESAPLLLERCAPLLLFKLDISPSSRLMGVWTWLVLYL